ncbi:MAG: 30S ribosomal protein S4 [Candidatus Thermoplasmatota archaeon]|nr:30S ribosomal protein S4 [Candidatus Thermoplasmatota archaeon]
MGHPKFSRPKFDTPKHPWKKARIDEEHDISARHGLKNMKEIWKARSQLRRMRQQAMKLIGKVDASHPHWMKEKDDLLLSLIRKGILSEESTIDDILTLNVEDILNRRLQARVYAKGLASSMKQARQLVTHGHITVAEQKITIPSYAVSREEEELIAYHLSSKLNDESHVLREIIDGRASEATFEEEEGDAE